jgi:hypothetical protein
MTTQFDICRYIFGRSSHYAAKPRKTNDKFHFLLLVIRLVFYTLSVSTMILLLTSRKLTHNILSHRTERLSHSNAWSNGPGSCVSSATDGTESRGEACDSKATRCHPCAALSNHQAYGEARLLTEAKVEGSPPPGQSMPSSVASWAHEAQQEHKAVRNLSTVPPHKEEAEAEDEQGQEPVQKHQPLLQVRNLLGCVTAW